MTAKAPDRELHDELSLVGLRADATAVGLLQLCIELRGAGVLDEPALGRIKDVIVKQIVLSRPRSSTRDAFEANVRRRIDALFAGREQMGDRGAVLAAERP